MKKLSFLSISGFFCLMLPLFSAMVAAAQAPNATAYTLGDFYKYDPNLEQKTQEIFERLDDTARVGQMIVQAAGRLGRKDEHIMRLILERKIGGVLLLNGTKDGFTEMVSKFNKALAQTGAPGLLYSADAEPSLINRKIEGSTPVKKNNAITDTNDCKKVSQTIANDLLAIGIRQNFAPVVDIPVNKEVIGNRSFSGNNEKVISLSDAFIATMQANGIIGTAKHFPGHGNVKGDTHHDLVYIDGELTEIQNYAPLIENGVLSIMVGHLAVINNAAYNTGGLPATCSPIIVNGLLKKEMGFKGLVITDAMGMGANDKIKNAQLLAVVAGNDMILMPKDEDKLITDVLQKMKEDPAFKSQVYTSVKKIIRLKICMGLAG